MTSDERLTQIETRQEHMISAIHGLTDYMEQSRDLITELMAWLQEPPSTDLPEALRALVGAIEAQGHLIEKMAARP